MWKAETDVPLLANIGFLGASTYAHAFFRLFSDSERAGSKYPPYPFQAAFRNQVYSQQVSIPPCCQRQPENNRLTTPAAPDGKKGSLKTPFIRFQAAFSCAKIKI